MPPVAVGRCRSQAEEIVVARRNVDEAVVDADVVPRIGAAVLVKIERRGKAPDLGPALEGGAGDGIGHPTAGTGDDDAAAFSQSLAQLAGQAEGVLALDDVGAVDANFVGHRSLPSSFCCCLLNG